MKKKNLVKVIFNKIIFEKAKMQMLRIILNSPPFHNRIKEV